MTDDGTDSWWRKMWAVGGAAHRAPAHEAFDKESVAELSRRLSERAARQATVDPAAAAQERRAALQAWDKARAQRQKVMAGCAAGGLAIAALVWLVVAADGWPPDVPPVVIASPAEPESATAAAPPPPTSPTPPSPAPAAAAPLADAAAPSSSTTEMARGAGTREESIPPPALRRDEVREIQARLLDFGFNPGPTDGAVGRLTVGAAMRYQQERSLAQTGTVDRSLLEQLRQDSSPQVAPPAKPPESQRANPRAARPGAQGSGATARRQPGPLDRLGRWLDLAMR